MDGLGGLAILVDPYVMLMVLLALYLGWRVVDLFV